MAITWSSPSPRGTSAAGGGRPAKNSRAWKLVPVMPLRPTTPTICPGNAAICLHSATLSCTRTLPALPAPEATAAAAAAREPSSSSERSFSRPSRPSQRRRPQRTTSDCVGRPTVPRGNSPSSSPRLHRMALKEASQAINLASRAVARSSNDSSIQEYVPCRGPVQNSLLPNSSTLTTDCPAFAAYFARPPLFTVVFSDTCTGFKGGSGVPLAGSLLSRES
mmetsp:Transcript_49855/g.115786  ORF Transcript_49855/g.115786 Transcript_49855/m.115786 type:complete len:221 (+) Transcript_49855:942-1604(+)